ncbi:NAD(P)H-dependent oxidoreductase [Alkaliflexus imshenetskii]|uniref:NAD(P)H-dependent oxidoreductase n=1 Tax=Alkaliflexus imshenetskii TaxID=286730 RepID=UPI00047DE834|nr:NAD(P)H-dependent oxidoreductase [Alkaliflexus imshenetskii]
MNVLVVYCHPSKESFTYRIFESFLKGLSTANHSVVVSDLYSMNFQTDMSLEEYNREGFACIEKPLSDDVCIEQQKIQQADSIVFIYPVWWSDCPAKLKGWFDRVYSVGFAYGYDAQGHKQIKMKRQKLGLVLCTAGHSNEFLLQTGIAESMRKVMIDDRLGPRFESKQMHLFGGTINVNEVMDQHIHKAYEIGANLDGLINGID